MEKQRKAKLEILIRANRKIEVNSKEELEFIEKYSSQVHVGSFHAELMKNLKINFGLKSSVSEVHEIENKPETPEQKEEKEKPKGNFSKSANLSKPERPGLFKRKSK